jgi:Reverse transcriptase (RNA-dependent DNA polymerase)
LVAKGFTQVDGVYYEKTFSLVVRFALIRIILALVATLNLELYQMDVKITFLNGELNEKKYMNQPAGFVVEGEAHKVCRLRRSIYGLKHTLRQWNLKFHQAILSYGFKMIEEDHYMYITKSYSGSFLILLLYVDNILLASNNKALVKSTQK